MARKPVMPSAARSDPPMPPMPPPPPPPGGGDLPQLLANVAASNTAKQAAEDHKLATNAALADAMTTDAQASANLVSANQSGVQEAIDAAAAFKLQTTAALVGALATDKMASAQLTSANKQLAADQQALNVYLASVLP